MARAAAGAETAEEEMITFRFGWACIRLVATSMLLASSSAANWVSTGLNILYLGSVLVSSVMIRMWAMWFGLVGDAAMKAISPPSGASMSAQSSMALAAPS